VKAGQPLCPEHLGQQQRLGVSVAAFTARADVVALPGHGTCAVVACPRQLPGRGPLYCDAHLQRLRCLRRAGRTPDEMSWRLTEPPVPRAGQVSLAGLSPAVAVEMLFGLQQRTRQGVKTSDAIFRSVSNDARSQQVSSLAGLVIPAGRGNGYASVVNTLVAHVRRGTSDPGRQSRCRLATAGCPDVTRGRQLPASLASRRWSSRRGHSAEMAYPCSSHQPMMNRHSAASARRPWPSKRNAVL
jgi:hypothetical protein